MALTDQDEKFWDFMNDEYKNIINEFSLSVFGIAALFFAAGQANISAPTLAQLIDLIGFGASLTMWIHMYDASRQIRALREQLRESNPLFMVRNTLINSWRHKGLNRIFYFSVTRLMTYFMGLVALAWLELTLNGLGTGFGVGLPLSVRPTLLAIGVDALLFAFSLTLVRRSHDIIRSLVRTPTDTVILAREAWLSCIASLVCLLVALPQLTAAFVLSLFDFQLSTGPYALVFFTIGSMLAICSVLFDSESKRLLQAIAIP